MFHFDRDFTDKNGERFMFPIRIRSLLKILEQNYVLKKAVPTGDFAFLPEDLCFSELNDKLPWMPFPAGSGLWGEPDQFVWFRQSVTVPLEFAGQDVWYVLFPYMQPDIWPWGQPQVQMFVNGNCVCGLDNNHRRHLLIKNARGGEQIDIALKAYSDRTYYNGSMTMRAELHIIRPQVYELFRSISVPLEAAALMKSDSAERIEIVSKLNAAMNILRMDLDADSKEFSDSVAETSAYLDSELYGSMRTGKEPVLWAIGHTHIDVAWLWTYHVTRNKASRSFATALRMMEQNPDFLFMSSQAQLYEFVKHDSPELYAQIKERIKQKRWEPEGGMWVEADTNLTGGESLVRQFLFGKHFFKKEFGRENEILWLPDVFGYSANLPQICRRSGIKYFYTTKIGWNEYNKFPYDTFRWRGLDGSTVLTHFGCAINYAEQELDWMTTYNPTLEPGYVIGAWNRYQQKDLNREILFDFGFGDGGGGPTQEMIDYGRRFEKGIPGCPVVKFAGVSDFFHKLDADVSDHPRLPEWSGEMYLEFHRGTYTSQAMAKKNNRRSEQLYHDVENLSSFVSLLSGDASSYPADKLNENWKLILLNQFHDVLPGSSIRQVYEDCAKHYLKIRTDGEKMKQDALERLCGYISVGGEAVTVFNTLSCERDCIVFCDHYFSALKDTDGSIIPCQQTSAGETVFVALRVPPKGWKTFYAASADESSDKVSVSRSRIETDLLSVSFDSKMHITSLLSKPTGFETLPAGKCGGRLLAYEDVAMKDDAWNVQAYYREKCFEINDVSAVNVLESGPVRGVIRVERRFRNSLITTDIIAYAGIDMLYFDYNIDWHEQNLFVKAEYPVDVNASSASYDIQFGHIQRQVSTNTLWDFARFEHCGHKWADLSDGGFGLAILNDCKYGFDASRDCLRISLLKCSTYPDRQQDQGHHSFSYALYPHCGDVLSARVRDRAYGFNYQPISVYAPAPHSGALPDTFSLFEVDAGNVVIETIKKAEDSNSTVLRLYEAENKRTCCTLKSAVEIKECYEADLMENAEKSLRISGNEIPLVFRPFEIKTLIISI